MAGWTGAMTNNNSNLASLPGTLQSQGQCFNNLTAAATHTHTHTHVLKRESHVYTHLYETAHAHTCIHSCLERVTLD